jgi:hypothetical protein
MYNALKRAADALPDPVTGEYQGISTAFDIEGVAAFLAGNGQTVATPATRTSKRVIR